MKAVHIYWISITLIAVIHISYLSSILSLNLSLFAAAVVVGGVVFLLYKKVLFSVDRLSTKHNILLYGLQIGILILYPFIEQACACLILFLLFIGGEILRHQLGRQLAAAGQLLLEQNREIDHMNKTFLVVRKERHDFLKHISALHYMLENKENEGAAGYLNELVEGYKATNLSIQGERGTVAGILHQSYQQAKEKGIEFIYDLESPISSLPLADSEITALIGNILGNALDASEEWQNTTGKQAAITLQAYKRSGLFLINCKNHTNRIPNEVLDQLFKKHGLTTKTGNHEGLGTKIITDIVQKNQGHLNFIHKNETFTIHIKMPAIH